jgi:hypothetical protein
VAYITDALAIRQILEHLHLHPPERPPPQIRDLPPTARAPTSRSAPSTRSRSWTSRPWP